MDTMTQEKRILEHMTNKGGITSMEAFELYGITRLSARIFDLKQHGYNIKRVMCESVNRYGDICRFAKYYIGE